LSIVNCLTGATVSEYAKHSKPFCHIRRFRTNGHLDQVRLEHILTWEQLFLDHTHAKHALLIDTIREQKELSETSLTKLQEITKAFNLNHPELLINQDTP